QALQKAGIEVSIGLEEKAAQLSLLPYLFQRKHKKPFCILKAAISCDGRIAAKDGSSQWISTEEARHDAHILRAESQAILIGANTANKDLPRLTVRHPTLQKVKQPLRVVLDKNCDLTANSPLCDISLAPTLVFTSHKSIGTKKEKLLQKGVEVVSVSEEKGLLNLEEALSILANRDVLQLLVEGGASILSSFIDKGLAQRLLLYVGPCILGEEGLPLFSHLPIPTISHAKKLKLLSCKTFGETVRLEYDTIQS